MIQAHHYGLGTALLATLLLVSACGIKPKHMEPPAGAENKTFPRTYPAPK